MIFWPLIKDNCSDITKMVSDNMSLHLFSVSDADNTSVPKEPILYRWWFPSDSPVMNVLNSFCNNDADLRNLMNLVGKRQINGKYYYALYFGKSNNGFTRFCQHTKRTVEQSTLRQTIYGLCVGNEYDNAKEEMVSDILRQCYYEWTNLPGEGELVECIESICIALGNYPLNLDGNPALSKQWRKYVMEKRKLN